MKNFSELMFSSPEGHETKNCPFKMIREKSLKFRAKWVELNSVETLQYYYLKHLVCKQSRKLNFNADNLFFLGAGFNVS